ncbi:hypothetical protein EV368DRAFT_82550 [Lentinula lateritia]|uniref:Uncharacterized protein n=1 Tax=Lentinula aff. lateritia TaxID=2804960 RepID=A0ACC1U0B9_9AGAR|nr:hypothetical protein F5876DRAFT_76966 [Lentinula aff. lateritia]KAJ3852429.1 hypothetical protein EV368DRAFT_82550 [Lentinula lateritia]
MPTSTLSGIDLGVDRNPPINTLYVGNLPLSPPLGYTPGIVEDYLRELFQTRPGYQKLLFRQKRTGSVCYVEFEDVSSATKAIDELDGNALNGLAKDGGIHLSFSKNPLSIQTHTSANRPD